MKNIILTLAAVVAISTATFAQTMPMVNGQVTFQQTFTVDAKISTEDAYAMVQKWFTEAPAKFTRQNAVAPFANSNTQNKKDVDVAFNNVPALQSVDPESNRMASRVLVKYYGGATASIKMLYIEYYMVVQLNGSQLTVTVSGLKYHHFNQKFAATAIYNWQGGHPADANGTIESLMNSDISSTDLSNLAAFLNSDTKNLFGNLQSFLNANSAVASN